MSIQTTAHRKYDTAAFAMQVFIEISEKECTRKTSHFLQVRAQKETPRLAGLPFLVEQLVVFRDSLFCKPDSLSLVIYATSNNRISRDVVWRTFEDFPPDTCSD